MVAIRTRITSTFAALQIFYRSIPLHKQGFDSVCGTFANRHTFGRIIFSQTVCNLLGDKAYDTKEILAYINEHGATVVIPPKSNAKEPWQVDYCLYKERHLVECFFQKIKWFRRVATRYDKLDKSFLAFVYIPAIMIWLL